MKGGDVGLITAPDLSSDQGSEEIILHPTPSSDPNDPLVSASVGLGVLNNTDQTQELDPAPQICQLRFRIILHNARVRSG